MDGRGVYGPSEDPWSFKSDSSMATPRSSTVDTPELSKGAISISRLNDRRMAIAVQTIAMKPSPPAMPPIMAGMLRGEGQSLVLRYSTSRTVDVTQGQLT